MRASRLAAARAEDSRRRFVPALERFAADMVRRDAEAAARDLRAARAAGAPRRAAEETALMLVLYGGYPAALEALRVLQAAWPGTVRATREGSRQDWRTRGAALCARVYGASYARLLPAVRALHPDLAVWMEEQGYGRVLARPGMSARERELVTVAALAALGWERQLVSHVLGAERVGASRAEVLAALRCGGARAERSARVAARRTITRWAGESSGRSVRRGRPAESRAASRHPTLRVR